MHRGIGTEISRAQRYRHRGIARTIARKKVARPETLRRLRRRSLKPNARRYRGIAWWASSARTHNRNSEGRPFARSVFRGRPAPGPPGSPALVLCAQLRFANLAGPASSFNNGCVRAKPGHSRFHPSNLTLLNPLRDRESHATTTNRIRPRIFHSGKDIHNVRGRD